MAAVPHDQNDPNVRDKYLASLQQIEVAFVTTGQEPSPAECVKLCDYLLLKVKDYRNQKLLHRGALQLRVMIFLPVVFQTFKL